MMISYRPVFAAIIAMASVFASIAVAQTTALPAPAPVDQMAPAKPKVPGVSDPHWLSPEEIAAIAARVPAPPAPGSPADQADLQTEIDVQNTRTPERSEQAKKDATLAMSLFLADAEPAVTAGSDPKFYFLFQQVGVEVGAVSGASKARFGRPRPFIAHGDVFHPLGTIGGFSYPSGHATTAFCDAVILAQIFPDKAALFLGDANRIAESRVIMGVHYTTDIQEGEKNGREVARELLTKPDFLSRLAEVKAEVGAHP